MIDPVIFTFHLGSIEIVLRWYGVFVMFGVLVGGYIAGKEVSHRGENPDILWDGMIWLLPVGVLGARLWYVVNATLGGNPYYMNNPLQIINIPQGGLHFFGGLLFGAVTLWLFLKKNNADIWLFLDSIAPALLVGQALARPANFINQELYGWPTSLPWGIPIAAEHRLELFSDLAKYPVETTRFHPTFAYEMIWNLLAFAVIMLIVRRTSFGAKPGAGFGLWLMAAGFGRAWIELFRPDQPVIAGSWLTTSMLVSLLMGLTGAMLLLAVAGKARLGKLKIPQTYTLTARPE